MSLYAPRNLSVSTLQFYLFYKLLLTNVLDFFRVCSNAFTCLFKQSKNVIGKYRWSIVGICVDSWGARRHQVTFLLALVSLASDFFLSISVSVNLVHLFLIMMIWYRRDFLFQFIHSFINLFIYSFVHSFIHSFVRLYILSLIRSLIRPFIHSFIQYLPRRHRTCVWSHTRGTPLSWRGTSLAATPPRSQPTPSRRASPTSQLSDFRAKLTHSLNEYTKRTGW